MSDREKAGRIALGRMRRLGAGSEGDVVERRRAPRVEKALAIRITVPNVAAALTGQAVNISRLGLFIATRHPPAVGTVIDLELCLPGGELLIHATAEIQWARTDGSAPGVGARFVDVSFEAQALIDELVRGEGPSSK